MSVHSPGAIGVDTLEVRSLTELLDPSVLANPYPLYRDLRERIQCTGILTCTAGW